MLHFPWMRAICEAGGEKLNHERGISDCALRNYPSFREESILINLTSTTAIRGVVIVKIV